MAGPEFDKSSRKFFGDSNFPTTLSVAIGAVKIETASHTSKSHWLKTLPATPFQLLEMLESELQQLSLCRQTYSARKT
jgi:hypothetical protein